MGELYVRRRAVAIPKPVHRPAHRRDWDSGRFSCEGLIRLAFLSPEITEAILDGRQPLGLTAAKLMQVSRLPLEWRAQRQALGFS